MSKSIKKVSVCGGSYVGKMYRNTTKLEKKCQTKKIKSEDKEILKKVVLDLDGDVGFKPFKYRCRCENEWSDRSIPYLRNSCIMIRNEDDIEEYKKYLRK